MADYFLLLDVELFGLKPGWHHLTSVLFHAGNAVLLYLLLQGMTGAVWRSALVAGLFALQRPSLDALTPRLVERADLTAAGALIATRETVGMLLGPAIGGLLIVGVGLPTTFNSSFIGHAGGSVSGTLRSALVMSSPGMPTG